MSLRIEHLVKVFGTQRAVDAISFSVEPGSIVGFLGPNGAGKSTTMKIITGYLAATSGKVFVNDIEISQAPLKSKRSIGYLAEHNPLYPELYVHEYLKYAGGIMGLSGKELSTRVKLMIQLCGLELEQNKRIELLSKGYRQRVGLAQALLHDPAILILDEPTSGLDPNQLVEIRNLIQEVSFKKTVIFSTHILQEVEAICQQVIVINRGKLVANAPLKELLEGRRTSVIVEFGTIPPLEKLRALPEVATLEELAPSKFRVTGTTPELRQLLFRFAADHQLDLTGLQQENESLETIFHRLTLPQ